MRAARILLSLFLSLLAIAEGDDVESTNSFVLGSSYFRDGENIPAYFTCKGPNESPDFWWYGQPDSTHSFALMMKDTSVHAVKGERIHWVGWNINGSSLDVAQQLPFEGSGDFKTTAGYRGPCPADSKTLHTYSITLFALDSAFQSDRMMRWDGWRELRKAIRGHVLARAVLTFSFRLGQPMVLIPPKIHFPPTSPGGGGGGGGRAGKQERAAVAREIPATAARAAADRGEEKKEGKSKRKLSAMYSPDLLCYSCTALVRVTNKLLPEGPFVRNDARSKREQAAAVEEVKDRACAGSEYLHANFPPARMEKACRYLISEFDEEIDAAFLHHRQRASEHLCWDVIGACENFSPEEVSSLGSGPEAAEDVDPLGRRWVRNKVEP